MRAFFPALALALLTSLLLVLAAAVPKPGRPVVAIFPPTIGDDEALRRLVATGWLPLRPVPLRLSGPVAVLARPDAGGAMGRPQGVWLMIDANDLTGCG